MEGTIQGIIFDMDNTLFDLVAAKQKACRSVALYFGCDDGEILFDYFTRPVYGFEDWRNIRDYLVDQDIFTAADYHRACTLYETEKLNAITPYPGIYDVLRSFKTRSIPLALVTDADMSHATGRLNISGLAGLFGHMVTFEMTGRKKPDHAPFMLALKKLGTGPSETVMIGDSPVRDLDPARAIGMRTVYARYGDRFAGTRGDITGHVCIDDIPDLNALLMPLIRTGQ
jgi:putative hydrolase of the HAD superfamily